MEEFNSISNYQTDSKESFFFKTDFGRREYFQNSSMQLSERRLVLHFRKRKIFSGRGIFTSFIKGKKVYVHPGEMFGFPNEKNLGRIVLSLLTETESFETGLKEILSKTSVPL